MWGLHIAINRKHKLDDVLSDIAMHTNDRCQLQKLVETKGFVKVPNKHTFELIDKFLTEKPVARPSFANALEQVTTEDLSVSSVIEKEGLSSETLAKIHVQQENFEKAIEIYKQLILKYPEKNTYFANQIKIIESRINKNI